MLKKLAPTVLAALVLGLLAAAPATAADPVPAGKLKVTGYAVETPVYNRLAPWRPSWGCDIKVSFQDTAPAFDSSTYGSRGYQLLQDGEYIGGYSPDTDAWDGKDGDASFACFDGIRKNGSKVTFTIEETAYTRGEDRHQVVLDRSAPITYTMPAAVGHPSLGTITQKKGYVSDKAAPAGSKGGELVTGVPTYINFTGSWQSATTFRTVVGVVSGTKGKPIEQDGEAYLLPKGAKATVLLDKTGPRVTQFTAPAADAGKYLFVTVIGSRPDRTGWSFTWNNFPGGFPVVKAQPASWVTSYGKTSGTNKVGSTVKVSKVTYSAAGKKAGLKVKYQWYSAGKALKGATASSHQVAKAEKGKKLTVTVTSYKTAVQTRSKTLSLGTTK